VPALLLGGGEAPCLQAGVQAAVQAAGAGSRAGRHAGSRADSGASSGRMLHKCCGRMYCQACCCMSAGMEAGACDPCAHHDAAPGRGASQPGRGGVLSAEMLLLFSLLLLLLTLSTACCRAGARCSVLLPC